MATEPSKVTPVEVTEEDKHQKSVTFNIDKNDKDQQNNSIPPTKEKDENKNNTSSPPPSSDHNNNPKTSKHENVEFILSEYVMANDQPDNDIMKSFEWMKNKGKKFKNKHFCVRLDYTQSTITVYSKVTEVNAKKKDEVKHRYRHQRPFKSLLGATFKDKILKILFKDVEGRFCMKFEEKKKENDGETLQSLIKSIVNDNKSNDSQPIWAGYVREKKMINDKPIFLCFSGSHIKLYKDHNDIVATPDKKYDIKDFEVSKSDAKTVKLKMPKIELKIKFWIEVESDDFVQLLKIQQNAIISEPDFESKQEASSEPKAVSNTPKSMRSPSMSFLKRREKNEAQLNQSTTPDLVAEIMKLRTEKEESQQTAQEAENKCKELKKNNETLQTEKQSLSTKNKNLTVEHNELEKKMTAKYNKLEKEMTVKYNKLETEKAGIQKLLNDQNTKNEEKSKAETQYKKLYDESTVELLKLQRERITSSKPNISMRTVTIMAFSFGSLFVAGFLWYNLKINSSISVDGSAGVDGSAVADSQGSYGGSIEFMGLKLNAFNSK
eukprot:294997_1